MGLAPPPSGKSWIRHIFFEISIVIGCKESFKCSPDIGSLVFVFVFETVSLSDINRNVETFRVSVPVHNLKSVSWTAVWAGTQHRTTAPVYQATSEYAALKVSITKIITLSKYYK